MAAAPPFLWLWPGDKSSCVRGRRRPITLLLDERIHNERMRVSLVDDVLHFTPLVS
jgi:hypothetical protein